MRSASRGMVRSYAQQSARLCEQPVRATVPAVFLDPHRCGRLPFARAPPRGYRMLEPTYLRCLRVALLAVLLACGACERNDAGASTPTTSPGGAQLAAMRVDGGRGFTGVFHASVDGRRRVVNLTERDGHLTGMIDTASLDAD